MNKAVHPGKMNLPTAMAVVAGSIIGSGIFIKPAVMAGQVGSASLLIVVWIAGGILSLCGALIFAEMSAIYPESGGMYLFIRKIYGDLPAFLFGWAALTVINTASVASIAFICARYAGHFISFPSFPDSVTENVCLRIPLIGTFYFLKDAGEKLFAIAVVVLLTAVNQRSLRASGNIQLVSTVFKVGALSMLIAGIFFSGNPGANQMQDSLPAGPDQSSHWLKGFMLALTGAFMAYDGWQNISSMGSEVQQPQKNLPLSILGGLLVCIIIYVLVNIAYVYALPVQQMAQSKMVASDALRHVLGNESAAIIAAFIVIATFGAANGNIMATSRITYVMAGDGLFNGAAAKLHPRFGTPAKALAIHCWWTCLLIASGSFDLLADMFVFVTWIFIIITCLGLMKIRKNEPSGTARFKMKGYPYSLILFLAFALFYVLSTLSLELEGFNQGRLEVIPSILGLFITLTGWPVFRYFRKGKTPTDQSGCKRQEI